jgi:hypothetical protein
VAQLLSLGGTKRMKNYIFIGIAAVLFGVGCSTTSKTTARVATPEATKPASDVWEYSTSSHFLAASQLGDNPGKSIAEAFAIFLQSPETKKMVQDGWQPTLMGNNYALVGGADSPAGYYLAYRRLAVPPNTALEPTADSAFSLAGSVGLAMRQFGGGSAFVR